MISLICYLYILMWDIPVNKEAFACYSTVELGVEIVLVLLYYFVLVMTKKGE